MSDSPFKQFSDIPVKQVAPGFYSKLIHTSSNTINFIEVHTGSEVPLHQHVHEQYTFVLEGEFELTVNGETRTLTKDSFALIPSDTVHGGRALTPCKLLDIFNPVREDYRALP